MIELIKNLIAIESLSGREQMAVEYIKSELASSPGTVESIDNVVIWKNKWHPEKKTIALGAHLDTVPFQTSDWKVTQPTTPVEQDGKLYGRGACDMKAGAGIILDLVINQDVGEQFNVLAFWYDKEELGIPNGVTTMLDLHYFDQVDLCIIPEPTACAVNYGVFGNLDAKIISSGIAAHSSNPRMGRNAIYQLIPVLEQIRDFSTSNIAGVQEAISANIINGGKAINVIPDEVILQIDYRFDPNKTESDVIALIKSFERPFISTEIIGCFPGVIHDPKANHLLNDLMNRVGKAEVVPFWSDIGQLGAKGIVAVNFGPGSINQAHTADEWVSIDELYFVRKVLSEFLQET